MEMYWYIVPVTIVGVAIWCLRGVFYRGPYKRFAAWVILKISNCLDYSVKDEKKVLFQRLDDYREIIKRDLKILEIGSGTAPNLEYYPANSNVVCLEPNPFFDKHAAENINAQGHIKSVDIVRGFSEDIPLESDSFDIAVCTFVLCSVSDVAKSLQEIRRVLKPDGMFLFIEHVAAEKGSWTRLAQKIANPIYFVVFDGCYCDRETETSIRESAMKDVQVQRFHSKLPFWENLCIMGSCAK